MNKENNCQCVVCNVEAALLDLFSTQIARTQFQERQGLAEQGSNPNYNVVDGEWNYNQTYILNHIVQNLPSGCSN